MNDQIEIPNHLYHATRISNFPAIRLEGLKHTMGVDGFVYMANKLHYAAGFAKLHRVRSCVVIEVDTSQLDHSLLALSDDHNPDFFPDDLVSWTYEGLIPPEALSNPQAFEFEDVVEFTQEQQKLIARLNAELGNG